jgi:hypothetical protein
MVAQIVNQPHIRSSTRKPGLLDSCRLPQVVEQVISIYDWLAGPPRSEQERINRKLAEYDRERLWTDAFLMGP